MNERFMNLVFRRSAGKQQTISESMYSRNLSLIQIAAVIVLCVSAYWIVIDRVSASYNLDVLSKISVFMQMAISVFMFVLPYICKNKKADCALVRIAFVVFFVK